MLFKSLPPSHRLGIFLAVFYTGSQMIGWEYGTPLRPYPLLMLVLVWALVIYQSLQRGHPSWQFGSAWGFGQPNLVDTFGAWFDRQPATFKVMYWLVMILAALIIYRVL